MLEYNEELTQRLGLSFNSLDSNNNNNSNNSDDSDKRGDKYSLRPRAAKRKNLLVDYEEIPLCHTPKSSSSRSSSGSNSSSLSLSTSTSSRKSSSNKPKSAPLSKYRRKTANARERSRMREINMAFEALRRVVPQITPTNRQQNEKLTKITTLRLAMKYISTLTAALTNNPVELPQQDIFSECSELESLLLESDGESLRLNSDGSDHSLTSPVDFSMDFDDSLSCMDFSHDLDFDPFLDDLT